MTCSKSFVILGFIAALSFAAPAYAQRGGGHGGGGGARGGAVARGGGAARGGAVVRGGGGRVGTAYPLAGGRYVRPYGYGGYRGYGYRGYYGYYGPGLSFGFYGGFGWPYYYGYYGYPYAYYYGYPYGYPYTYGYPYPAYPGYSTYPGYSYPQDAAPQQGAMTAQPGAPAEAYGGVRIDGAPHDAQVFVDGHYAGVAGDFDGPDKHLNLTAGTHDVEIRPTGQQPMSFDVNVPPNQTITLRAR